MNSLTYEECTQIILRSFMVRKKTQDSLQFVDITKIWRKDFEHV